MSEMNRIKCGIITINDPTNYGNRLQNYALTTTLSKYGSVETIEHPIDPFKRKIGKLLRYAKTAYSSSARMEVERRLNISCFTNDYIGRSRFKITPKKGIVPCGVFFDRFVIGSDQVWNYRAVSKNNDLKIRLGLFFEKQSSISYAASFGVSSIPDELTSIYRDGLSDLRAISVREDRGAELVREMTGLDATVVLDPTLMLTADKWLEITKGFVPDGDRYVLTYFLGRPSDEQERDIQAYAKAHGCRVRRILDLRDRDTYVAGPQDFVELFSKARYVFTDSYHACCFSILFHKQFTVFNRAGITGKSNMNSRMETLFRLFDLDSVMMDSGLAPEIDYRKVDRLLEQHRRESQDWLDRAMEE